MAIVLCLITLYLFLKLMCQLIKVNGKSRLTRISTGFSIASFAQALSTVTLACMYSQETVPNVLIGFQAFFVAVYRSAFLISFFIFAIIYRDFSIELVRVT